MRTALAALILALAGCASAPPAPNTVRVGPPEPLLQDCPAPEGPVSTNGELAALLLAFKAALAGCNADKAALRGWSKGL